MSRHGYTDDNDDPLAHGRWRGAVRSAIEGRRGQAMLRELLAALDAMPVKEQHPDSFATPEGEFCALGALGAARGMSLAGLEDCDRDEVGRLFGIAPALAAEVMYLNDEWLVGTHQWVDVVICGPMRPFGPRGSWRSETHERSVRVVDPDHPAKRWAAMRAWVAKQIEATGQEGGKDHG